MNISTKKLSKFCVIFSCSTILISCSPNTESSDKTDNYSLMLLATTMEKSTIPYVTIEPLLISNGVTYVTVYDYCRTHYDKTSSLKSKVTEITSEFLAKYCNNKSFTFKLGGFLSTSNSGSTIELGAAKFKSSQFDFNKFHPPALSAAGKSSIVSIKSTISGSSTKGDMAAKDNYFFLLESSKLLKDLIPVYRANDSEFKLLAAQAKTYLSNKKGIHHQHGFKEKGPSRGFKGSAVEFNNPIVLDIDNDNKLDIVTGVSAQSRNDITSSSGSNFIWQGMGIVRSSGGNEVYARTLDSKVVLSARNRGVHIGIPIGMVKFSGCLYAMLLAEGADALVIRHLGKRTQSCKDVISTKYYSILD